MAGAALTTLVRISWRRGEALASTTLLLTSFPSTGFSAMAADTAARPCPSPPLPPPPPSPAGRPYNDGGAEPRQAGRAGRGWVGAVWRQGALGRERHRSPLGTSPPRQQLSKESVRQRGVVGFGLVWFGLQKNEMLSSPDDLMGISVDRMSPLWPFV